MVDQLSLFGPRAVSAATPDCPAAQACLRSVRLTRPVGEAGLPPTRNDRVRWTRHVRWPEGALQKASAVPESMREAAVGDAFALRRGAPDMPEIIAVAVQETFRTGFGSATYADCLWTRCDLFVESVGRVDRTLVPNALFTERLSASFKEA